MRAGAVNRMLAVPRSSQDLINKLEAVRLVCQETGCAQRYLAGDGFAAILSATQQIDAELGTDYGARFAAYLEKAWAEDLAIGIAMTDAKGDRTLRPYQQANPDAYLHIASRDERRHRAARGEGDHHRRAVHARTAGDAVPQHDRGRQRLCRVLRGADRRARLTLVARPAGRPGEAAAKFSGRYGQSTAVGIFEDVFVPWERVFLAGRWRYSAAFTYAYATHHRHTCIAARAGFGDLLIGAGVADDGGERHRPRPRRQPARQHGRADQDRRRVLRLRRRRLGVLPPRRGRRRDPRHGFRQRRQTPAGHPDLRHAPPRTSCVGRPDRDAAGAGRGSQSGDRRPRFGAAQGARPTFRTRSASKSPGSSKT